MSRSDYVPPQFFEQIRLLMNYENALAIEVSLKTGLRIGDVLSIKKTDIKNDFVSFVSNKTKKAGKKYIGKNLARRLLQISGKEYVFVGRDCETKHRTRQAVYKDLVAAAHRLGVDLNVTPHSARKVYAVGVYKEKGLKACKEELQHDRDFTTIIYAMADKLTENKRFENLLTDDDTVAKIAEQVFEKLKEFFSKTS